MLHSRFSRETLKMSHDVVMTTPSAYSFITGPICWSIAQQKASDLGVESFQRWLCYFLLIFLSLSFLICKRRIKSYVLLISQNCEEDNKVKYIIWSVLWRIHYNRGWCAVVLVRESHIISLLAKISFRYVYISRSRSCVLVPSPRGCFSLFYFLLKCWLKKDHSVTSCSLDQN